MHRPDADALLTRLCRDSGSRVVRFPSKSPCGASAGKQRVEKPTCP